ncbi:MAG TPA: type II toxin-antitoxin system VapC family toxin [Thermoanaerobaculia bacterium]|nr:type II toxin-antitoxin system VapC family toxin [Thermoanaerobaculia bacterium]
MIVDTSAVVAILEGEANSEELATAIMNARYVGIGAPNAVEAGLVLTARFKRNATGVLLRFFGESRIQVVPFTNLHWQRALDAFERFGKGRHPAGLNFGDCMTYATASLARQPLLCRGDDFRKTDIPLV